MSMNYTAESHEIVRHWMGRHFSIININILKGDDPWDIDEWERIDWGREYRLSDDIVVCRAKVHETGVSLVDSEGRVIVEDIASDPTTCDFDDPDAFYAEFRGEWLELDNFSGDDFPTGMEVLMEEPLPWGEGLDDDLGFPFASNTAWVAYSLPGDMLECLSRHGYSVYRYRGFIVVGIDGAGYSFYDQHHCPLYEDYQASMQIRRPMLRLYAYDDALVALRRAIALEAPRDSILRALDRLDSAHANMDEDVTFHVLARQVLHLPTHRVDGDPTRYKWDDKDILALVQGIGLLDG